jgi:L-iditol 2-dehydrogenase
MRRALLTAPRTLSWEEKPTPAPEAGEVTVRIKAALTCGTDLKTYRRGHPKLGFGPFGHEAAGDIAAVGYGVQDWRAGDAVMWVQTAPCGRCARCKEQRENLCEHLFDGIALGAYGDSLTLARKIVAQNLFAKPPALTYIEAAFLEPLACVVHGWQVLNKSGASIAAGRPVAIVGAGTIGLLHLCYAKAASVPAVVIGRGAERLELARRLGAVEAFAEGQTTNERLFATVIECAGTSQSWERALQLVQPGGHVLFFSGLPADSSLQLDATRIHYEELTALGSFHFSPADVRQAQRMLGARTLPVRELISGVAPLSALAEVFARLDRRDGYKYALLPEPLPAQWD